MSAKSSWDSFLFSSCSARSAVQVLVHCSVTREWNAAGSIVKMRRERESRCVCKREGIGGMQERGKIDKMNQRMNEIKAGRG